MALEPEIQYMVVEVLVTEFERLRNKMWSRDQKEERYCVLSTLLSLRMTCKSFASAKIIKTAVFKEITLQATTLNFNLLRQTRISSIAPSVAKINFLPSPFTISLGLTAFTRVIRTLSQHVYEMPPRSQRHIVQHWGDIPRTEDRIGVVFKAYRQQAYIDQDLVMSGELQCLWTATLLKLEHVNDFELFSLFGRHPLDPSDDLESGTVHCRSCYDVKCTLYDRAGTCEDQMFRTTIQCLAASKVQIKTLSIHRALAKHFRGWQYPSWDKLDLTKLEIFKFPDLNIVEENDDDDDFVELDEVAETGLNECLRKAMSNLKELSIDHYVEVPRLSWPRSAGLHFPRLRSLKLGGVVLTIPWFAELVSRCVALEEISLRDCHPQGVDGQRLQESDHEAWEVLFDAMCRHPNLKRFAILDEWDANSHINEGVVGATRNPNTVGLDMRHTLLWTGMERLGNPANRGLWDDALQLFNLRRQN
ncbi:uncharacterized protein Z519_07492 [Cladophialophora bantiana CBS 173.52]|uniref:F-box domain-containing protein n=1 Tax=Cladophialophora bantiana (strain ATCC 10958 / CBS 173.52 / CDC B-1940 / NIH 8579) TaxID=1442370 RepID=A0A0D2ENH4_CLAB1|nr:uncharacterized protein Z519_07492 [Cladophialophora bantiana CBS 173.52]KIW91526.1 hypothetical protein Z519_07492 [Cladophialophora bantiana CBS 173.52]